METENHRERLEAKFSLARPIGVDVDRGIVSGYVMAQEGHFKTPGRGQFDKKSLRAIVDLTNKAPDGLVSRYGHVDLFNQQPPPLGRVKNARIDGGKVRADLHIAGPARKEGRRGAEVLEWLESDPGVYSSSLVLDADFETPKAKGDPPIWRPTELFGSDIVPVGEAVDSVLSADDAVEQLHSLIGHYSPTYILSLFDGYQSRYMHTPQARVKLAEIASRLTAART